MWRGVAKAALLTAFGRVPAGPRAYRAITRTWIDTQATHPTKLARAWPGYVQAWRAAGVEPDGARVWVFEGGWTPIPLLANLLVTGRLGVIDALIAATGAAYDIPVFTRDADFEGLAGAQEVRF